MRSALIASAAATVLVMSLPVPAHGASAPPPTDPPPSVAFASSFEPGDTQPTWINTAERSRDVTGALPGGIPGSIADRVVEVTASGENTSGGEVKENLNDG